MQITMGKRWRHWAICALIVVVSVAGARLSGGIRFFRLLHLRVQDFHFIVRGVQPVSNIVMVMADQKAYDTFKDEPTLFWHPHYADAIQAASEGGARVMGLDLAFGVRVDRWQPDADQVLAGAVSSAAMPVILAYAPELNTNQVTDPVPVNMIAAALDLNGFPNITADEDDSIRYQELIESPDPKAAPGAPLARSLAMRVAEKYLGSDAQLVAGRVMLQGKEIPVARERTIAIDFAGPAGTFPQISLVDFTDAWKRGDKAQLRKWVEGKVVLLGTDAKADRFGTPFFALGAKWTTPGVEIHANTVNTLIDHRYLRPVPSSVSLIALLLATTVAAAIILYMNTTQTALWMVVEVASIAFITHALFRMGWLLSTSETLLGVAFCGLGASFYRFWRGALFRKAISIFVGRELATSLDTAEDISRSGTSLTVTILFTDIRGFTAWTERVSQDPAQGPEVVVKQLNEYLEMMVALIDMYGAHVNKFIGDGILAVFSDKDRGAKPGDHARRAVECATRMVTATCGEFKTGSGIHTGLAVVGNIGSKKTKMEFTVLGDTVNLASRLESLNKEMHTCLLMSDVTQRALGEEIETVQLGAVPVRGKTVPIYLYTVASLAPAKAENASIHA